MCTDIGSRDVSVYEKKVRRSDDGGVMHAVDTQRQVSLGQTAIRFPTTRFFQTSQATFSGD